MADRYADVKGTDGDVITTAVTDPTTSTTNSSSSTSARNDSRAVTNTSTQNMDPKSLAALQTLIEVLSTGGTQDQKTQLAKQDQVNELIKQILPSYTTTAAKADAEQAMAGLLRKAMEENAPAIAKSVQGAGTSASSMQGLLATKLSTEASQSAAALGLNASAQYGNILANLLSTLSSGSKPNDMVVQDLIQSLNIAKGSTSNTQSVQTGTNTQSQSQFGSGTTNTSGGKVTTTKQTINNDGSTTDSSNNNGSNSTTGGRSRNSYLDIQVNDPYAAGRAMDQAIQDDNFDWDNVTDEQIDALDAYYNS